MGTSAFDLAECFGEARAGYGLDGQRVGGLVCNTWGTGQVMRTGKKEEERVKIEKEKVEMYFSWLKENNHLYKDISLDENLIDQFITESTSRINIMKLEATS